MGFTMRRFTSRTAALQLVALLSSVLNARTPTGAIDGTISDPSGVAVTEAATGRQILVTATAAGAGRYSVRSLLPGTRRIQVMVSSHQIFNESGGPEIGKTGEVISMASDAAAVDMAPARFPEALQIVPSVNFNKLFNHAPGGSAGGLAKTSGILNYDYSYAAPGNRANDLDNTDGRIGPARKVLIGIRANFWSWREGGDNCPRPATVRRKS